MHLQLAATVLSKKVGKLERMLILPKATKNLIVVIPDCKLFEMAIISSKH